MNDKTNTEDNIIGDLHRVRAQLLAKHKGDVGSLLEEVRRKEAASGRKVIKRLNPPPRQQKAG